MNSFRTSTGMYTPGAKHEKWWLLLIIVAAIAVRVIYFLQVTAGPCVAMQRWEETDMSYYDFWARTVAAGDWWSRRITPPMHYWHKEIAKEYFRQHPQDWLLMQQQAQAVHPPIEPETLLWIQWSGEKRFYQDPGYPYLIALTYILAGSDLRAVIGWQFALGLISIVMVYLIARQLFSPVIGLLAGALSAACAPLLFYEAVLLRNTVETFTGLLLVYLTLRAAKTGQMRSWLLVGVIAGLAILVKEIFLLYVLMLALGIIGSYWLYKLEISSRKREAANRSWRSETRVSGSVSLLRRESVWLPLFGLVFGVLLGMIPLGWRNVEVGLKPWALCSTGGITFLMGNTPNAQQQGGAVIDLKNAPRILGVTHGKFLSVIIATLKTHPSYLSILRNQWDKIAASWSWQELPNNVNFYFYREFAPVLRFLPITFMFISPLALAGMVLSLPRLRRTWPLLCMAATFYLPMMIFFVLSRFRSPLAAALMPFVAYTLVTIASWVQQRLWLRTGILLSVIVLLGWWCSRPMLRDQTLIQPVDFTMAYELYYSPLIRAKMASYQVTEALDIIEDSLRHEPGWITCLSSERPARNQKEMLLAQFFAKIHSDCAQLYQQTGALEAAKRHNQRVQALTAAAAKK